jgi:hypothetical protein
VTVLLCRVWTKTNDGPWTLPMILSPEEIAGVLSPYQAIATSTPGFLRKRIEQSASVRTVIYEFSDEAGAVQLHAAYHDRTIQAVAKYEEFVAETAKASGTVYQVSWRMSRKL